MNEATRDALESFKALCMTPKDIKKLKKERDQARFQLINAEKRIAKLRRERDKAIAERDSAWRKLESEGM